MRFVVPIVPEGRPWWMLRAGLWLYDKIGGRKALPPTTRVKLDGRMGLQPEVRRGYEYSDCWVDDARLVVLLARDAADRGAEVRTRCAVTRLAREGHLWRIEAQGENGGEVFHAAITVNAEAMEQTLREHIGLDKSFRLAHLIFGQIGPALIRQ